jgi:acetyl esterase
MAAEGASLDLDAKRLAAGGDSAGANLALGAALAMRDAGEAKLAFLLLVYGVYSTDADSDSWLRLGTGAYGLSRPQVGWILENYLSAPTQRDDWRVAPLLASMKGLPPAHLLIGTLDPLWDDNQALKRRFDEAGVPNRLVVYEGLNHGFIRYGSLIRTAQRAVDESAAALGQALR